MAINFPNSPQPNDSYTQGNRSWTWTGVYWRATSVTVGFTGSNGLTGSQGDVGFTGSASTEIGYTGSSGELGYTGSAGNNGVDGVTALAELTDVDVASAEVGQVLGYTGSNWMPTTVASAEAVLERHYRKTGTLTVSLGSEKWYIPVDSTVIGIIARVETAPTGTSSGIEISVNVTNTAGDKTAVATLNINNSYKASDVFSTPLTVLFNEFVTVDITSVGTSTAGADLTVTFTYTRN